MIALSRVFPDGCCDGVTRLGNDAFEDSLAYFVDTVGDSYYVVLCGCCCWVNSNDLEDAALEM